MNNRILSLVFAIAIAISCLSLGCSHTSTTFSDPLSEVNQDNQRDHNKELEQYQTADFRWLQYANPRADASFAIEKQDFTLLAFAGRATSLPGINSGSSTLQQQCGYRLLANSGDALRSQEQLNLRKQLYQYAATFNQLVAAACQKNNYQNKAVP
jgi:hypothetical protein